MNETTQSTLPEVTLRVPGSWHHARDLARQLPAGYEIDDETLRTPDGSRVDFEVRPRDDQFSEIFRSACRREARSRELRGIDNYSMIVLISGVAGSMAAARRMLETGAVLLTAGGYGVFSDISALAHGRSDWLELAEHGHNPNAVFYAYINITKKQSPSELVSFGMHAFGQRDAVIASHSSPQSRLNSLEDYLRSACASEQPLGDGDVFNDKRGAAFRLRQQLDTVSDKHHPMHNPFGRWRLEPMT